LYRTHHVNYGPWPIQAFHCRALIGPKEILIHYNVYNMYLGFLFDF
jgi:hypothetical protein